MRNDLQVLYEGMETEAAVSAGSTTGTPVINCVNGIQNYAFCTLPSG